MITFPPRNETWDFTQQLNVYYRDVLLRPPSEPGPWVDLEGQSVWEQQYLQLRVNGASHQSACESIWRAIQSVVNPQPPSATAGLQGTVRVAGRAFVDETGARLLVGCHLGDGLSRYARGHDISPLLDSIAGAGYHFTRTWSFLAGSYWAGRTFDLTTDMLCGFLETHRARGLKVLLSQGDLFQSQVSSATHERVRRVILDTLGRGYRDVILGVDACNEPCNNSDATPQQLADWLAPIARAYPDLGMSLGAIIEDDRGEAYHQQRRKDYSLPPANLFEHHISGPDESVLIGRHWTEGYESPTWLHRASEPRGAGARVTPPVVSDVNRLCAMAVASVMTGGEYTWFSGPGVVSDEGERLEDMAGFREVPALIASLPQDLHTWPTRCHGGDRFKGTRVYAVPAGENSRAEHTISADGRFVCLLHQNHWERCYAEKDHRIERQIDFGGIARLIVGTV